MNSLLKIDKVPNWLDNLWFCIISTAVIVQRSFKGWAASSSFSSCFFLSFSAFIPDLDDPVLGKVVASYVGQWNVALQHGSATVILAS